ncbi:MAG TPA: class I SAM-dependent methyltransferase [Stenotrophomonas sp.]
MAERTAREIAQAARCQDRLVHGNWMDPDLLAGERYDTVLADYLLGAIEGYAPYWQDQLFARLRPLVGGRLYVIGLNPYVHGRPEDPAGRLVNDIARLRDACFLLAGDQPYREYPLEWTLRQLERANLRVVDAEVMAISYRERFVHSQLDMCTQAITRLDSRGLAVRLQEEIAELRQRALAYIAREGGLRHGHDYLIVAEPV